MGTRKLLDGSDISRALTRISHEIIEANRGANDLVLVGIPTRGVILAKRVTLPSGAVRVYPEYESVSEASRRVGVPYQDVYRASVAAAERARLA